MKKITCQLSFVMLLLLASCLKEELKPKEESKPEEVSTEISNETPTDLPNKNNLKSSTIKPVSKYKVVVGSQCRGCGGDGKINGADAIK